MDTEWLAGRPKIVVLDGYTLNPGDLSWAPLEKIGDTTFYDRTHRPDLLERAGAADILLVNKFRLDAEALAALPHLKCICVTATGYDNIDLQAAREHGIMVCNAVGYSTESVAQHVFALLLEMTNHIALHHQSVLNGDWSAQEDFSYWKKPIMELSGKNLGIYGYGRIGQMVGRIGLAMGMRVLAHHKHPERDARVGVTFVSLEKLFENSDVITLHAPLTPSNREIVNARLLNLMKPTAYLINTGRGGLIDETDLYHALQEGRIAGAALDVLSVEPPPANHPLFALPNCLITPHQAWASREARQRLLEITVQNIRSFLIGAPQNVVN